MNHSAPSQWQTFDISNEETVLWHREKSLVQTICVETIRTATQACGAVSFELVAGGCGCEVGGTGVGAAYKVHLLNADAALLKVREWHRDFDAIWA